jgi:hypothetical protein
MLRLTEVRVSLKRSRSLRAKNKRVKQLIDLDGPNGHYRVVFSIDRPPLLAVGLRLNT